MSVEMLIPIAIIGGLGLFFGVGLSFASKKFEVQVDERIKLIRETLPGANCAACGYTGCDAFAEAVAEGKAKADGCPVGGAGVAREIRKIMGTGTEEGGSPGEKDRKKEEEGQTARVLCGGTYDTCKAKYKYEGIEDCDAATALYGGPSACNYGCVGLGTCVRACPFGGIVVENGLARVLESKCKGCGLCVKACPKNIIKLVPRYSKHTVLCSSHDRGLVVRQLCDVGCIACLRCVRICTVGAISMDDQLAVVNPQLCMNCGECVKVCPTSTIKQL
ncbi:MAG: RnfABCDGE type electron transport complex subunit B [Clostridiaceae bacterium]|nr:RnfABCDGE type electron transport complex subunit B [Clostridiaceae bacterium]